MTTEPIQEFFEERVPAEWFAGPPSIESDEEEILCVGPLPEGTSRRRFREATRTERMEIAREAESRFGRRRVVGGGERRGHDAVHDARRAGDDPSEAA